MSTPGQEKEPEEIRVNDYILRDNIGEGNFGKVKLGISKLTGEEFAIKIINKEQIKIKMKNKIFKENEVIVKFNHINVIFVYEIIEDPKDYFIVTEYCKNGELFDYIVKKEKLSEDEASIFFYQLINGVEHIHSKNIAHRDLKPENLLLTKENTLKIIDFGLSHEFDGTELLKTKCGSPSYAAPEILRGKPYDGFKSDVWCCGIILYAMVCGYLPFDGDTNKILFKNILKCRPDIPECLGENVKDLIKSILTPDPDRRITIGEIKNHKFYLRGKELCKIDYHLIEKNVLKNRKNKSSFRLNDDDNFFNNEVTVENKDKENKKNNIGKLAEIISEASNDKTEKVKEKIKKKEKENEKINEKENEKIKEKNLSNISIIKNSNRKSRSRENNRSLQSLRERIVKNSNSSGKKEIKRPPSFKHYKNVLNTDVNMNNNGNNDNKKLNNYEKENMQINNLTKENEASEKNNRHILFPENNSTRSPNNLQNKLNNNDNRLNKFLQIGNRNLRVNIDNFEKKYTLKHALENRKDNNENINTGNQNKDKVSHIINSSNNNNDNLNKKNNLISFFNKFKGNFEKLNTDNISNLISNNVNLNNDKTISNNENNENIASNPSSGIIINSINSINSSEENLNTEENDVKNEKITKNNIVNIGSVKNINKASTNKFNKELKIKNRNISLDKISLNSNHPKIKISTNANEMQNLKNAANLFCNSINININNYNIKPENHNFTQFKNKTRLSSGRMPKITVKSNEKVKLNTNINQSSDKRSNMGSVHSLHSNNMNYLFEQNNSSTNRKMIIKTQNDLINNKFTNDNILHQTKTQQNFFKINDKNNYKNNYNTLNSNNINNYYSNDKNSAKTVSGKYNQIKIMNSNKNYIFKNIKNDICLVEKRGGSEGNKFRLYSNIKNIMKTFSNNNDKSKPKNTKDNKNLFSYNPFEIKASQNCYNIKTYHNNNKRQILPKVQD